MAGRKATRTFLSVVSRDCGAEMGWGKTLSNLLNGPTLDGKPIEITSCGDAYENALTLLCVGRGHDWVEMYDNTVSDRDQYLYCRRCPARGRYAEVQHA